MISEGIALHACFTRNKLSKGTQRSQKIVLVYFQRGDFLRLSILTKSWMIIYKRPALQSKNRITYCSPLMCFTGDFLCFVFVSINARVIFKVLLGNDPNSGHVFMFNLILKIVIINISIRFFNWVQFQTITTNLYMIFVTFNLQIMLY